MIARTAAELLEEAQEEQRALQRLINARYPTMSANDVRDAYDKMKAIKGRMVKYRRQKEKDDADRRVEAAKLENATRRALG